MIRIAQAASSEYFSAWGVPPNQRRTGVTKDNPGGNMDGELNVVAFYGPWEKVFRPVNSVIADRIAYIMEETVRNGAYGGYGQNNGQYPRTGLFDLLLKMDKPEPMKIKTLFNVDCSSSSGAAIYFAGVRDKRLRDMWTGSAREILLSTGEFVELSDQTLIQSAVGIKRGDVLWKTGHMAICLDTDGNQETEPFKVWYCKSCNLRTGPSTLDDIIKTLHPGDIVEKISTADNGWIQVKAGNDIGYLSTRFYKALDTLTSTFPTWLRSDCVIDEKTEIIVIPEGATVYITGETRKVGGRIWYKAIYAGKTGWASSRYLR